MFINLNEIGVSAVGNDVINSTCSFQDFVACNCAPGAEKVVYASFGL